MLIEVDVSRYYDWERAEPGEGTRSDAAGVELRRIVVDTASTTSINIPEAEIRDQVLAAARSDDPELPESTDSDEVTAADPSIRSRVVARYVEDTVMPWHAPRAAIVAARVVNSDEPEVDAALQRLVPATRPRKGRK